MIRLLSLISGTSEARIAEAIAALNRELGFAVIWRAFVIALVVLWCVLLIGAAVQP